jgi:subtilisin family serine protease
MKRIVVFSVAALALALACSDDGTEPRVQRPVPAALAEIAGNGQRGTVGSPLAQPLVVEVRDREGRGVSGVEVAWQVTAGGGSVSATRTPSDSRGRAQVQWTLGTRAGENAVTAQVTGVSWTVTFIATGDPDRPAKVVLTPDTLRFEAIGDTIAVQASINDRYGNAVASPRVVWTVADTGVARVDTAGRVVSRAAGETVLTARADTATGSAPLTVIPVPRSLQIQPSADTLGALGESVQFSALVRDANGNEVAGAPVAWNSTDPAVASVDATGLATARANGTAGIVAAIDALSDTATLRVEQRPAGAIAAAGDGQTGRAGEPLPTPIAVQVRDANGFGVPGIVVEWTPAPGSGSLSASSVTTDEGGIASVVWTLGRHSGEDTVTATVPVLSGARVVFTAIAMPNGTITGTITITDMLQSTALDLLRRVPRPGAGVRSGIERLGDAAGIPRPAASAAPRSPRGRQEFVAGSFVVTYRAATLRAPAVGALAYRASATARAVAAEIRSRVARQASDLGFEVLGVSPAILAARVRVDPARAEEVRARLLDDPAILAVEPERLAYALEAPPAPPATDRHAARLPNDRLYPFQSWHYEMIDLPEAWQYTTGGSDVLVAVVDDGVRFDHPDLAPNLTTDGYDFVSMQPTIICGTVLDAAGDGDGYDPDPTIPIKYDPVTCAPEDAGGHGVHVAGTIGAVGNDRAGVTGVNWSVRIRPVRVLGIGGSGSLYDIAQGILYAAGLPADDGAGGLVQAPSRAAIINLSLGGYANSTELQNAVQAAHAAGSLLIAAAGNDGVSVPMYPAAYPEVVSVSAVGPEGTLASYSNFGSTVDIAAPGGDMARGDFTFGVLSTMWNFAQGRPTHQWTNGTSMAAPHVSGVAALLLAQQPSLSAAQLRARLLDYAVDLGAPGRDDLYGHGLLNARNSLTQSFSPARALYARLYDAARGAILQTVPADAAGRYAFTGLDDGDYRVYAGEDRDGDGLLGVPGRRWGAYSTSGITASPGAVTVDGAGEYATSFSIGMPVEAEPNDGAASANVLPLGGYFHGMLSTPTEADYFVIHVPALATYTFETSGWDGACGFALEEDTKLALYDSDGGTLLAFNDDADFANFDLCSRITVTLAPGAYYLEVTGYRGLFYRVEARPAS